MPYEHLIRQVTEAILQGSKMNKPPGAQYGNESRPRRGGYGLPSLYLGQLRRQLTR